MKKNELISLRKKDLVELRSLLEQRRTEAAESFAKIKAGQEKNLKKSKNLKREIAQIMTITREKELLEQSAEEKQATTKNKEKIK